MKIILATDHAGYKHKEALKNHLIAQGHHINDMGTDSDEPCDYPDLILPAARAVAAGTEDTRGVIFGGSGQGEAMSANRVKGVRATVYYGSSSASSDSSGKCGDIIELSRTHNNANILSIGARFVSIDEMKSVVDRWLGLAFLHEERHVRRILKMDQV